MGLQGGTWDVGEGRREDVVVVRYERDQHGDPIGAPLEHTIPGCLLAPEQASEDVDRGDTIVGRWRATCRDPEADITATDRVRRPGDPTPASSTKPKARAPWMVVGDPEHWTPGTAFRLERVQG